MKFLIMYSAQESIILKSPIAEQILKAIDGFQIESEINNLYYVDEHLYMLIRVEIPFFQQQPMLVNFFSSNYEKSVIVEGMHEISTSEIAKKMAMVEVINEIKNEPT